MGLLALAGGRLALILGVVVPLSREKAARGWMGTPCTVVTSEVRHSTRKGRSHYWPEVV